MTNGRVEHRLPSLARQQTAMEQESVMVTRFNWLRSKRMLVSCAVCLAGGSMVLAGIDSSAKQNRDGSASRVIEAERPVNTDPDLTAGRQALARGEYEVARLH